MGYLYSDLPMTYLEKGSSHKKAAQLMISLASNFHFNFCARATFQPPTHVVSFSFFSPQFCPFFSIFPFWFHDLHNLSVIPCDSILSLRRFSCHELVASNVLGLSSSRRIYDYCYYYFIFSYCLFIFPSLLLA